MKIPIVWPAVILAVLIGLGVSDHLKLRRLRDRQAELTAALANRADPSATTASRGSRMRRGAQTLATECLNVGSESELRSDMQRVERRETELRKMELLEQVGSMSPGEVERFLADVRASVRSGGKLTQFLDGVLYELSGDHPRLVLDFFSQTQDELAAWIGRESSVSETLRGLVAEDPASALEWMKANPGLMTEEVKQKAISGAATNDPRLAFKLIGELECGKPEFLASLAAFSARTAGVRTDMVAVLREYIPTIPTEKLRKRTQNDAFGNLAGGIVAEGFEKGATWIDQARLAPEELAGLADGLASSHVKGPEAGRWLEWAGATLQGSERESTVKVMMFYWAGDDPSGAASWLAGAKESPLRNLAIQGYVDSVSRSEPEAAIEWALALPSGKSREDALKLIHKKWPRHDPAQRAAADAFAKVHGIK